MMCGTIAGWSFEHLLKNLERSRCLEYLANHSIWRPPGGEVHSATIETSAYSVMLTWKKLRLAVFAFDVLKQGLVP